MSSGTDLQAERQGERVVLRSPEVGLFTCAHAQGTLLSAGMVAGVLHALGRQTELRVPSGVQGRVVNARAERVLAPVGYGTVLYELAPLDTAAAGSFASEEAEASSGAPVFRAPYSGRFWHRPSPNDPAFVREGAVVREGETLGLIEVMKTFTHLVYSAAGGLPARARVLKDGGGLLEVEPA